MVTPHARSVDMVLVQLDTLTDVTTAILQTAGLDGASASYAADALIAADLRGVDSHGVSNMLRTYVRWLETGHVNPRPAVSILREAPATAVYDSDAGLGIAIAPAIMDDVLTRAESYGIGFATTVNGRHLGMLAHTAMLALPRDMIGICATAGGPRMVPTFGREARLGTNPLAIAVPTETKPPFVFDSASTVVPVNKVANAERLQLPLPPGLFVRPDGQPVTEQRVPCREDTLHLAPLGSRPETGSHKGYGLSAAMDILCNVLSGGLFGFKAGHGYFGHFFAAINVAAFSDLQDFKAEMDEFLDMLNHTPPAEGQERVLYAGQAEWETEQRRRVEGIPLHAQVVAWLHEHCSRIDVDTSALPR